MAHGEDGRHDPEEPLMAVYRCRRCGHDEETEWDARCPGCHGFYAPTKFGHDTEEQKQRSTFAAAAVYETVFVPTGIEGFDKTTNGGLVPGTSLLLGGFPNAGKSTLACLVADAIAKVKGRALYASSEEGVEGVISIAKRIGCLNENVEVLGNQSSVEGVITHAKETKAYLTVFDSLTKYRSDFSGGSPGSIAQVKAVTSAIISFVRETKRCAIIVNQVGTEGDVKGGTEATHNVDVVLALGFTKDDDNDAPEEESPDRPIRILCCEKNRRGPGESTYWRMTEAGVLESVPKRSRLIEFPSRGKYRKRKDDDARD